jgi:hypothetical protein
MKFGAYSVEPDHNGHFVVIDELGNPVEGSFANQDEAEDFAKSLAERDIDNADDRPRRAKP